ncbi:MAG: c-type cytochrome [Candidatus Obscuribacterales bacterium]|nr:c-type cytochrome [Candidatus Obscuribacterales bacterium]
MSVISGIRLVVFTLLALSVTLSFQITDAAAKDQAKKNRATKVEGQTIFNQYCASCHQDGGNVTVPSKTVAGSNKLATVAVFKDYLNNPVGHMPFYKNVIDDKATLDALYRYCKSLKKESIKQVSQEPMPSNKL